MSSSGYAHSFSSSAEIANKLAVSQKPTLSTSAASIFEQETKNLN